VSDPLLAGVRVIADALWIILPPRSFYPLYPVPQEAAQDVNLDLTHHSLLALNQLPDILILPSQLTKFAKVRPHAARVRRDCADYTCRWTCLRIQVVDSVVVVNPGRLSQFSSGGTFAKLAVHPMDKDKLVSAASAGGIAAEAMEHDVFERCRVDIVRI
jgi:DNA polymerase alpha subunit B